MSAHGDGGESGDDPDCDYFIGGGCVALPMEEALDGTRRFAEAIKQQTQRRKEQDERRRMRMMEEALEGEDAMSSYDPHGHGFYRGVNLNYHHRSGRSRGSYLEKDDEDDVDGGGNEIIGTLVRSALSFLLA